MLQPPEFSHPILDLLSQTAVKAKVEEQNELKGTEENRDPGKMSHGRTKGKNWA